jgi:alpha-tubulin suppressor-like RCC1 family protein
MRRGLGIWFFALLAVVVGATVVGESGAGTAPAVTGVSVSSDVACAVRTDGTAWCWGADNIGQLGNGRAGQAAGFSALPVQVRPIDNAAQVSVSSLVTSTTNNCAVLSNGTVSCWSSFQPAVFATPQVVKGVTSARMVSTSTGSGSADTCVVLSNGNVDCWGSNLWGQLGDGKMTTPSATPVAVKGITNAKAVSLEADYACALLATGGVKCWGNNVRGQLGDGPLPQGSAYAFQSSAVPVNVMRVRGGALRGARGISTGAISACAVLAGGGVMCWGNASSPAFSAQTGRAIAVGGITGAKAITNGITESGNDGYCVLLSGGTVECWNVTLTSNGHTSFSTPTTEPGVSTAIQISGTKNSTGTVCALLAGGHTVTCWGSGYVGMLGEAGMLPGSQGPVPFSSKPLVIQGLGSPAAKR